ncbi:MAG: hypothetical protein QOI83_2845 [Streptomycetaceae bacterium]|nr:hypothetical protein [Streptomycetaceae bacterium]
MAIGFAPETTAGATSRLTRTLEPAEWTAAGVQLLSNPREIVKDLHARHLPSPSTAVVAVFSPDGRLTASASFTQRPGLTDGWERRNAILAHLRRVTPHDLRRRTPVRTAVLLVCREGEPGWTEQDGAWMWGLRDACGLHGLRCGAYITLNRDGWHIVGENRGGRSPHSASWARQPDSAVTLRPNRAPEALRRATAR